MFSHDSVPLCGWFLLGVVGTVAALALAPQVVVGVVVGLALYLGGAIAVYRVRRARVRRSPSDL